MKNIYMVQPNSQYGNSVYFPYAVGSLIAYAFKNEEIKKEYDFISFFYKKENIEECIKQIDSPFAVGFSCYVWNYEYNKAFARAIKEKWPECRIIFGGHQVNEKSGILEEDYIDYIILGEGEQSFESLLLALAGKCDIKSIPNLMYREDGVFTSTEKMLTQIPHRVSPYVEGYFDEIVKNEELEFSAILETNRGCPNRCAFCDWGNIKSRVRLYNMELVKKEIDWFSENRIEYVYAADANFGLFPRDEEIIDYIIQKHSENGYPQKFQATYSKNNPEVVFRINKRLNEAGMSKGATLSFQSMNEGVLKNIGRENMPLDNYKKLMGMYNTEGIAAYSEIIIGLPGETYDTMKEGIETLLECGQHSSINFFNCELLKNSIMGSPDYVEQYDIKTAVTEQHQYHVIPSKNTVKEFSDIVISTSSMTTEMWIDINIFSVFVRAFHNLGLLQCVAIYLYYEEGIKYSDFYERLIAFSKENPSSVCGRVYDFLKGKYTEVSQSSGSLTCVIPEFGELLWPLEEASFLKVILEYDKFYDEITGFIASYFKDEKIFNELMAYQKSIVKTPYKNSIELSLGFDFPAYFTSVYENNYSPLKQSDCRILIDMRDVPSGFPEYAERTVWYGRKGSKNTASNISYLER